MKIVVRNANFLAFESSSSCCQQSSEVSRTEASVNKVKRKAAKLAGLIEVKRSIKSREKKWKD